MGKGEAIRRQFDAFADIIMLSGIFVIREKTGYNGLAYLFAAYILYYFVWIIFGREGSSVIARILRGRGQRGQYRNLFAIKSRIMIIQIISGSIACVLLLICGGPVMEKVFGISHGVSIVMIFAPALLLRCLSEGYSGFIRGGGRKLPVFAASVMRSILYIVLSLLFGTALKNYGDKVGALLLQEQTAGMYAAIGTAIAVNVAEILILAALFLLDKLLPYRRQEGTRMAEPVREIALNMYAGRAEQILTGLLILLPFFTGLCVYSLSAREDPEFVNSLGSFVGTFLLLMLIMYKVQEIMVLPLAAHINAYNRKSDLRLERSVFEYGIHAMCIWGFYFIVVFIALSREWAELMGASDVQETARLFVIGSVLTLMGGLSNYFGRLLAFLDRRIVLLGNLGIMNIIFLIAMAVTTRQMEHSFQSVLLSVILTWGILCISEGGCVIRITGIGIDWLHNAGIPAAVALVTGGVMYFLARIMAPHIGNLLTIALCAALALVIDMILLVLLRNIREPELKYFPGGWMAGFFGKLFSV